MSHSMLGILLFPLLLIYTLTQYHQQSQNLTYNILNQYEMMTLSLSNYFDNPSQIYINQINSTADIRDILNLTFTNQPLTEVSYIQLTGVLDKKNIDFNAYRLLQSKSIYNHPNKVFLMEQNIIFSVRYQVSTSDNNSYVQVYRVSPPSQTNCTQMEVQYINSTNYLHVTCFKGTRNISIFTYRFKQARPDLLSSLEFLVSRTVDPLTTCSKVTLFSFQQLYVYKTQEVNQLLLFCTFTKNTTTLANTTFFIKLALNKGIYTLQVKNTQDQTLLRCLQNTSKTIAYQKGFLSVSSTHLRYYSFNSIINQTYCDKTFLSAPAQTFITSIQEFNIQYIYIIYKTKIIIKESYSPNYESIIFNQTGIQDMELVDYTIARRFLTILYQNQTDYIMLAFDLRNSYPKLVQVIDYDKNVSLRLFSVGNFLQIGNYFISFQDQTNLFKLNLYVGYELTVQVKDPNRAVGKKILALNDRNQKQLDVVMNFRDFTDLTLQKSSNLEIELFQQFFRMQISDYVRGPLGRFYNYPTKISAFQYINHQHHLDISEQMKGIDQEVIALALNNQLSKPILVFYFSNRTIRSCQLDYSIQNRLPVVEQCKTTKAHQKFVKSIKEIVVLEQELYLQFDDQVLQLCQLSPNGEYLCMSIDLFFESSIINLKLVSFTQTDSQEDFSFIMYGAKEVMYCSLHRSYLNTSFSVEINFHIREKDHPDLPSMSIRSLHFDPGYTHFLVLRLTHDQNMAQKVVVYEKPLIVANSASNLIGHVIESFDSIQVEALFCLDNLLIVAFKEDGVVRIKEYKVSKEYRLKYNRAYPLYNFQIVQGGRHNHNQNFIFLEALSKGSRYFLVFSPLLPSSNILSHKIDINTDPITFSQQIHSIRNSSLFLIGKDIIIGISLPNLVFKFIKQQNPPQMTLYQFNIGVLDTLQELSILTYKFSYNQKEEEIQYLDPSDIVINLNTTNNKTEYYLQTANIFGSVMDYNLVIPDSPSCQDIKIQRNDIFTKQKCLVYYKSLEYGYLNDFIALTISKAEIEVIVTDSALFCVKNKRVTTSTPDFNDLTDCTFRTFDNNVAMTCINSTTMNRQIFTLAFKQTIQSCSVELALVTIPEVLNFQDYNPMLTSSHIIFEVPISGQNNKIYYKTSYQSDKINSSYSLLRHQQQPNVYQTEFKSIDSFLAGQLFLLLEQGIGIYNISDTNSTLSPALWLNCSQINIKKQQSVYIKFLSLNSVGPSKSLIVEVGAIWSSFQLEILFTVDPQSSNLQTIYNLISVKHIYEYQHYPNCRNSKHSQSERYQNLFVKICDYKPISYSVFAGLISITNDTSNSLIQFFNRSEGASNSPIRTDTLYSNRNSRNQFMIRGDTMVVSSMFNLLCYYQLTPTLSWTISHNASDTDKICDTELLIFNKQNSISKDIQIVYDASEQPNYWTVKVLYIQRVLLILILLNTIRLLIGRRQYLSTMLKRKNSNRKRNHANRFEVMLKINSKQRL